VPASPDQDGHRAFPAGKTPYGGAFPAGKTPYGGAFPAGKTPYGGEVRLTAWVDGHVQGVGFRWWTRAQARRLGLRGTVANLPDGRVEVIAEGQRPACAQLLGLLDGPETPGRVTEVDHRWGPAVGEFAGFKAL
jgi:acylphosphatase